MVIQKHPPKQKGKKKKNLDSFLACREAMEDLSNTMTLPNADLLNTK